VASQDAEEQVEQPCPFRRGEARERGGENVIGDGVACSEDLPAGGRQTVFDAAAAAGASRDQILGSEPVGKRSKGLIALKRLDRQGVGGGARGPADGSERVPLGKRRPDSAKAGVERPVMPVLDLLHSSSKGFQIRRHASSIYLSKLAYIKMLR
jgi:hypothetical protein